MYRDEGQREGCAHPDNPGVPFDSGDISRRTLMGAAWSGASQVASQGIQMVIKIILARLLVPEDFGLVGMALIFTNLAMTLNELGLSAAIVQRKNVTDRHLSTAFWASALAGLVLLCACFGLAPLIASFFKRDEVRPIIQVLSLGFVVSSLGTVQSSMLQKEMDFRRIMISDLTGLVATGLLSVGLAFMGLGPWSLVVGSLGGMVGRTASMWVLIRWKPGFYFDWGCFGDLFSFGRHVMGSRLLNYVDSNMDYLVVGKVLDANRLGYYTLAYQLAVFPMSQISSFLSRVTFPAFSMLQDDDSRIRKGYLKVVRYTSIAAFPAVAGLALVAGELVDLVFGVKWHSMVRPLQVLCGYGLMAAVGTHVGSVILGKGRSYIMFRWNVFSALAYPAAVIIGVRYGLMGVAVGYTLTGFMLFFIIQSVTNRLIGLSYPQLFNSLKPAFVCTVVMAASVICYRGICVLLGMGEIIVLAGSVAVGVAF